jgi:hypothetical protein
MSNEERDMLQSLADAEGLTASDAVRQLVRRAYAAAGAMKPKTPKRKR